MAFMGMIGSLFSALGSMAQASAQAAAAKYNARVQEINAKTATDQAAATAGQKIRENRQRLAAGEAGIMQNGFEIAGTPLDVINQAEAQGNLDYLTALYQGKVAATGYQNNAQLYRMEAKAAQTAGFIGAGSALFGGLSDIYRSSGSVSLTV